MGEGRELLAGFRKEMRRRIHGRVFGGARIVVGDVIEVTDPKGDFPTFTGKVDEIYPLHDHYVDGKLVYVAEFGSGHNIASDNKNISVRVVG